MGFLYLVKSFFSKPHWLSFMYTCINSWLCERYTYIHTEFFISFNKLYIIINKIKWNKFIKITRFDPETTISNPFKGSIHTYIHICLHTFISIYVYILHIHLLAMRKVYIHPSIHPYIHTYIYTYIHTYM